MVVTTGSRPASSLRDLALTPEKMLEVRGVKDMVNK
jgi:hypothetical protein